MALDPAALRDREFLAGCDFVEAVCWLGARLAEALAYAHSLGVLHRDIKPANVLLNQYGRPMLADFNIATVASGAGGKEGSLGGTLAYMAPEHLDAFMLRDAAAGDAVKEPADIYSLGLVLFELLCGCRPFVCHDVPTGGTSATLRALADERRLGPPPLPAEADVPGPAAAVLRHCLDPAPARRYQSAEQLARALDGCRELRGIARSLPPAGPLTRALFRWPFVMMLVLLLLPHAVSGVVNIAYRSLRIVERLTPAQQSAYRTIVPLYIGVMYTTCVLVVIARLRPPRGVRLALAGPSPPSAEQVNAARRTILRLPMWCVALACAAWLPGGLVFPLFIDHQAGPLADGVIAHLLISCTISGLIALTYSYFAAQFIVLRFYYPMLWLDTPDVKATARAELAGRDLQMTWFQTLAVLIPLAAAVLMIGVGPEEFAEGYRTFRVLVTALIALGMAGLGITLAVNRHLQDILRVLTAASERR